MFRWRHHCAIKVGSNFNAFIDFLNIDTAQHLHLGNKNKSYKLQKHLISEYVANISLFYIISLKVRKTKEKF